MSPKDRIELAIATGETTSKGLGRKDCVLANVLRRKGEMAAFLLRCGNFGRYKNYTNMEEKDLVNHAVHVTLSEGAKTFEQLRQVDGQLYLVLRERQLTNRVADEARFKGRRRKTLGKANKACVKKVTRQAKYAAMTDDEIFNALRDAKVVGGKNLQKQDSVLYAELMQSRREVRERLVSLGWRRAVVRWQEMTLNDWLMLCREFETKGDFHKGYTAAYGHAIKSGRWDEICSRLALEGRWQGIYGFDGKQYQSRAECIVANWLHMSKVRYTSHPTLPLKTSRRAHQADFLLNESGIYIEVFNCSEAGLKARRDQVSWAADYIVKRSQKENFYKKSKITLLAIEAEIHRSAGLQGYLAHIRERFLRYGIQLIDPGSTRLDLGNDKRGIFWSLADFLDYAAANKFTQLSDFTTEGHRDLYAVLISRDMRRELERELDEKHGRRVRVTKDLQLPIHDLRNVCQMMNIRTKPEYLAAYDAHKLPIGAPSSIRDAYGVNWHVFFNGKGYGEFWPWERAREYVRARKFKSRAEFHCAVRTDPDMKYIRRNPDNRTSGGYPEFVDWFDFLGKGR